jgi:hypothetical protein
MATGECSAVASVVERSRRGRRPVASCTIEGRAASADCPTFTPSSARPLGRPGSWLAKNELRLERLLRGDHGRRALRRVHASANDLLRFGRKKRRRNT